VNYLETVRERLTKKEPEVERPRLRVITVRLPRESKAKLDRLAHELDVSLNQLCVTTLEAFVESELGKTPAEICDG
jgi:predicted transcriptional regulator